MFEKYLTMVAKSLHSCLPTKAICFLDTACIIKDKHTHNIQTKYYGSSIHMKDKFVFCKSKIQETSTVRGPNQYKRRLFATPPPIGRARA